MAFRRLSLAAGILALAAAWSATVGLEWAEPLSERAPVRIVETRPVETALGDPGVPETADAWLRQIRGARRTIDLEHFYLSTWPGEPLEDVLFALGQATRRGVRVRLLLDASMYRTYPRVADSLALQPGFDVRLIDMRRLAGGVQHAKAFIVDGETAFIGSQNLDWRALKHIHELGLMVRDPRVAAEVSAIFELDWSFGYPPGGSPDTTRAAVAPQVTRRPGELPIRLVQAAGDTADLWPSWSPRRFSPDSAQWDLARIVGLIDGARRELTVQALSYGVRSRGIEDRSLDDALRRAAARGVKVRLLFSDWMMGSSSLPELQSLARVANVEVKLSSLPEWSGGYIPFARVEHCKVMVVDSTWAWVGTSNWDPSYFQSSRNLAFTVRNRGIAERLRGIFATSWTAPSARPLDPDRAYPAKIRGEEAPPGAKRYGG
jgi:phosphatidylserine/phosphatidylglycerophosphate/cardiolipin synthase-like enzyme